MDMMKIELIKTKQNGYDKFVEFTLFGCDGDILWGSNLCYEYKDVEIKDYKSECIKDKVVEATISIKLVMNIRLCIENEKPSFIQRKNSTHTECVGVIKKILDLDSFICEIPQLGDVRVELERANNKLIDGMLVEFVGGLVLEM